jgi:enoyl-CoA hydratase/carnithine racemase
MLYASGCCCMQLVGTACNCLLLHATACYCRLPRLVGLQQAIQMMLTSTPINDKAGLKAGLLDAVVPQQQLLAAAKQRALDIAAGRLPRLFSLQRTGKLVYAVPMVLLWLLCCHVR